MKLISTVALSMILGFALAAPVCHADTITVVPGPGGVTNNAWNFDATIGWQFTLSSPVTVTELGFFDATGSGLSDPHPVGIWNGSGTLLGSATVPSGTAGMLVDGFRFVSVTPFTLGAGAYAIGAYGNQTSLDAFEFGLGGSTTIPALTLGGAVEAASLPNTLTFPTSPEGFATQGYFGPNFMVATIPEPSTISLLALAFGLAGFFKAMRRTPSTL
jgi:Domain of unknown function (DUF4082)/PEP-CTERM motif